MGRRQRTCPLDSAWSRDLLCGNHGVCGKHHLHGKHGMTYGRCVFSITLSTVLLLSACSSDKPVGGTIVVSSAADADVLFPPLTLTLMGKQVSDQVFDNLADIGPSLNTVGDAGFTPRLADRWQWAADSQSVAFHLNPRARWHDGVPVSAEDVRYTFQLVKDTSLASPLGSNLDNVDSVSVRDSLTAVVWFHRRTPDAFFKVASPV